MSDNRVYAKITGAGYRNLLVPDAFLENRGRMYEPSDDPDVQGDEIVPTFAQYIEFLGFPGGDTRFIKNVEGEILNGTLEDCDFAYFTIPPDVPTRLTGTQLRNEREGMNTLLNSQDVPWYLSIISAQEMREETNVQSGI